MPSPRARGDRAAVVGLTTAEPALIPSGDEDRRRALTLVPVSRETEERLALYATLLTRWQRVKNLVSPSTLPDMWTRHIADSAQIVALRPEALRWADMGSGAGFPGLVVAILLAERAGTHVHLVESNGRKCAFLREVARVCAAPATIHNARVEDVVPHLTDVDTLTARALALLPRLLEMGKTPLDRGATAVFLKSRAELAASPARDESVSISVLPSVTSIEGCVVVVRRNRAGER